jgi:uncharacterized protein YaaQ
MPKLLIAVVHEDDTSRLVEALRGAELRVTVLLSRGGFLQARNAMLYIGVDDARVADAMKLIEDNCRSRVQEMPAEPLGGLEASFLPTQVTHGGATVFVVPIEEIRRI